MIRAVEGELQSASMAQGEFFLCTSIMIILKTRGVEIQCQWHQISGAKSELGTAGLVIGNLLLSTSLKIIT